VESLLLSSVFVLCECESGQKYLKNFLFSKCLHGYLEYVVEVEISGYVNERTTFMASNSVQKNHHRHHHHHRRHRSLQDGHLTWLNLNFLKSHSNLYM